MLHQFLGTNTANAQSLDPYSAIEDGLVQRKQFNSHEEAEKLHKPEYAKALEFARKHITPSPDSDEFYRAAPKVEVIQKLSEIYDALPGLEKKKTLKIQFAPSSGAFDENGFEKQCQMLYPDEDFSDAAGVFFPSSDDAKSHTIVLRSNITSEAVCHEIGHVIHESNDPAAYSYNKGKDNKLIDIAIDDVYNYWGNREQSFISQINQIDVEHEYSGTRKILLNIIDLVFNQKEDDGHKELIANIAGLYLSRNNEACLLLDRILGFTFNSRIDNLVKVVHRYLSNEGYSFD